MLTANKVLSNELKSSEESSALFDFIKHHSIQIHHTDEDILLQKFPVTSIFSDEHGNNINFPLSKENLLLFYRIVVRTIDSLLENRYSDFDAHTTSNCCHGMALLARDLILMVMKLDLEIIREEGQEIIKVLEEDCSSNKEFECAWHVPRPLIDLASLYLLAFIRDINPAKGGRTSAKKLKDISSISTNFSIKIVNILQKKFSNIVAARYSVHLNRMKKDLNICGAPIEMWGKYIQPNNLRTDKYGIYYSSNIFSMQVALAQIIAQEGKLALVNDLMDSEGRLKGRYIQFFKGDGEELIPLSKKETEELSFDQNEPVTVFGGCVYSDDLDITTLSSNMKPWLSQFTNLVLACDIFYPHFPKVVDDPEFDISPIIPEENELKEIINQHSKIQGVSALDPSLFCLTHIYPASVKQVLETHSRKAQDSLPIAFIPGNKFAPLPYEEEIEVAKE